MSINISLAEIQFSNGKTDQALDLLRPVLKIAINENILVDFLDRGSRVIPLLQFAINNDLEPDYLTDVKIRIKELETGKSKSEASPQKESLVGPLTSRERIIYKYLRSHLTTTEIAAELSLSVHTVRSHIKNIYSKLGAHSRKQAIELFEETCE